MEKKTSSHPFWCLFVYFVYLSRMAAAQIVPVRVGVVLDMDDYEGGSATLSCISMALSDFYATHDHYRTRLVLTNRDSKGDVVGAAAAALDLLKNVEVQAIIGPEFSVQANFLIALGHKAHVPVVTFSATSPSLSSTRSPYFVRATLNDSSQVDAIGAIVKAFGWQEAVLIYEDNEFGEGIIPYLTDALEQVNARVPYRSVISPLATDDQIVAELYKLMTMQTRVFIVHMMSPLASLLFTKAKQLGMMSQDYAWIITDGITNELSSMDPSVIESMLGVIGVRPYIPKTKELDNFAIRYKRTVQRNNPKSPDLDIFKLWAYDSAIALAMAAEKARLRNPKYRDANISRNSTDLEAFGVSDAGPRLIQALTSTPFQGLAGDFQLVDGQLQAPPFEIVNMVGPGARVIGYWTKESGIVRELNLTSADKNKYSTSKSNLGSIIWPGDALSSPKGWVIPTNGKKLRVGVPIKEGFTEFVRVTWNSDNSTEVEGYCIDVFDAVMATLPYGVPYEYVPFAAPDHKMAGDYNAFAYQVYLGNFDAVSGDVTIVGNRSQYVDFTLPYTESGVSMVVPIKDDKSKNAWVFVKPLTWELWLTSFCSFVFIGILIWILEHRINEDFRGPVWYQVGMIFWFAFSTMVFAHKEKVVSNLARFVLIIWFLVVLILTQSYTASLASMLTVQKLQPTVNDVNVLIRNKEYVGYMRGSFIFGLLKKMNFDESRLVEYKSPEELDELLTKGSGNGGIAAAFHEIPYINLFLSKYCSKYMMVEPIHKADGFGFVCGPLPSLCCNISIHKKAFIFSNHFCSKLSFSTLQVFPIGSPLVTDVSRAILNVTEGQTIVEIERKWLGDYKTKCPDTNTLLSPKSLGLASFWGLFLLVGIAGIAALIIYVVRFLGENWNIIDDESSIWSKLVELLTEFDNKDLRSHTFKHIRTPERDDAYGSSMHSPHNNYEQSPSNYLLASPHTNGPPSPVLSSPSEQTTNFQGGQRSSADNATRNQQGESAQIINQEIELANPNEKEQTTQH
ncbi:glutamate receptor 2.1-like isoform X2 [Sesamum indicum]|uniref:Glutamate receptor 2.1-like isoform X2 n=1 Tax=Sesamum indicum TaxID=4182 RepID=A0A8M8UUA1_SESIN|nr:glutamate receptor 2.1-like isoform X2 [Sesamum indicum]